LPIFLLQAAGPDSPGILDELTRTLDGVRVLDIAQSVIHRTLNLGVMLHLTDDVTPLVERLEALGASLGLDVSVLEIADDEYEAWVARQGEARWIITLFGKDLRAKHVAAIAGITKSHDLNIAVVTRLSGRASLRHPTDANTCIEFSVRGDPDDPSALRRDILVAAQELDCDIAIQADGMYRRNRRMIAFDMDSTLIQAEVIDELARHHGVVDQVAKITEAAMNGELDFDQSLRRRLRLLRGLREEAMTEIANSLPITPGARRLMRTVRALGYKTAILSGGFTFFGNRLKQILGIDYVHANELEIVDGALTGNVLGPIVNGQRKADLLRQIAEREGISLQQVIAVGDGANDLPMLNAAGLGIAFHAKPKVRESAETHISTVGLDGILYMIGVRDREVPVSDAPSDK
jgi:phosphoserine phosphatase